MSYSRTFERDISYSGSVHYSHDYPASENGGTVSGYVEYSGSVPVTVNLYVDTKPFDNSVDSCNSSVGTLNGAVVTLSAAQVASIQKGADEVASHVITGFFNMIKSELDQNMAALYAKFKAVFELITTKTKNVEKQQAVMQDDYSRVSDRYVRIFENLDEELEKRVIALDKNVFEISKRVQGEQLNTEISRKVAGFLLGVNEDEILQQQLLIAKAKSRVQEAMDGLSKNVMQETVYSKKVSSIVTEHPCTASEGSYIPVIYTESSNLSSDTVDYTCYSNPMSQNSKNAISDVVKNYFVSNGGAERANDEKETKQIDEAFSLIAEREFQDLRDEKSIRVYELLKKLKEA